MCADAKDVKIAMLESALAHKELVTRELCRLIAKQEEEILVLRAENAADI